MPGFERHTRDDGFPMTGSVVPECVKLLLERFPHVQLVSLQLLANNDAFRELCNEYASCSAAADRLADSRGDEPLRREYNSLRLRLEGELLGYISQHEKNDSAR